MQRSAARQADLDGLHRWAWKAGSLRDLDLRKGKGKEGWTLPRRRYGGVGSGRTAVLLEPGGEGLILDPVVGTELGATHGAALKSRQQSLAMLRGRTYPTNAVHFDQSRVRVRCRHRDAIYDDNDKAAATAEEWCLGLRLPSSVKPQRNRIFHSLSVPLDTAHDVPTLPARIPSASGGISLKSLASYNDSFE